MSKGKHGVKVGDLAVLAGAVGLVEKSQEGQDAFLAWWNIDQKAARKALFSRVAARRAQASARQAQARQQQAVSARQYPGGWLAAAGIGGRRGKGPRVTEGRD
jgi:hypothetical protein